MDNYKLTYFNLEGIVEPIRLLFKYAGVPFEDNRIECQNWVNSKTDFKWQQLPVFQYNGKTLTQAGAIGNFLANTFNLVPEDLWDQAKCEEIIGAVHDLRLQIKPLVLLKFEGNAARNKFKELKEELMGTKVPLFLENLHELLQELRTNENLSTDMILGGTKPSWADFCLAHFTEQWEKVLEEPTLLDKYPLLKNQQKAVFSLPSVAEYISERPQTIV